MANKAQLIQKRKGKYLAQAASAFELLIEPRVPKEVADKYKAILREKFKLLGDDAVDIAELDDKTELNAHAIAVKDTLDANAGVGGNKR